MLAHSDAAAGAAITPHISVDPLENLSGTAQTLYRALCDVGRTVGRARGYVEAVTVVHFFCPGEVVADACAMARSTLYRKLEELRDAELVTARAHYVTHRGRTRADGMVWAVKLCPDVPGPVSVPLDYLKASYRCLSADIEAGRTAWALLKSDSHKTPSSTVDIQKILAWALPPPNTENPDMSLTVRPDLERVLDVPSARQSERRAVVDGAARALATGLRDARGLMFYRLLLWQLLRAADRGTEAPFYQVYLAAQRARADAADGFARSPGALFVSRLKAANWYADVMRAPAVRVGSRPNAESAGVRAR